MKIKAHTLMTCSLLLTSSIASAGLYRWVDDKGEVHFSDKVPVAASKKAHTEIDKSGISQRELDPEAKIIKQQELEKLALAKAEEEEINKKIRAKRAKIRKRDHYLLSTYENKDELIKSFKTKIKMLKGNSAILSAHKERLEKKLLALQNKVIKPDATKNTTTTSKLDEQIVNIKNTITQYEKVLLENDKELISLNDSFNVDLKRYLDLTN